MLIIHIVFIKISYYKIKQKLKKNYEILPERGANVMVI